MINNFLPLNVTAILTSEKFNTIATMRAIAARCFTILAMLKQNFEFIPKLEIENKKISLSLPKLNCSLDFFLENGHYINCKVLEKEAMEQEKLK